MFLLSSANEAILDLLEGHIPEPIPLDRFEDCDDTRQLIETLNELIKCLAETKHFLSSLAEGRLDVDPPKRNFLISPFKHLHANLRHLVWQTQQVARGDLSQRVDFLGDFSVAFNSMIDSLRQKDLVETALCASEEKFSKAFMSSPDALSISKLIDGAVVSVNEGFKRIFGFGDENEIIGKFPLELAIWDNPEDCARLIENLKSNGGVANFEACFRSQRGDSIVGLVSASIIELNGELHILSIIRDITEYKRLEHEKFEIERKIHDQKLESLSVMAGGIAHDFNNKLTTILGNLELALMDRALPPETQHALEKAFGAAKQSTELSRQMQIYTGKVFYSPVSVDINQLLNRNRSLLKLCISKNVTLNLGIYGMVPFIQGDVGQIQRLVVNIMVNASEAIGDKSGEVTLTTGVIDCDETYLNSSRIEEKPSAGRFVYLNITDSGCGMDVHTIERIFDPFFSTKFTGRGLGMAEVMGVVRCHNGAIFVDSRLNEGTTIRVLFPAQEN